MKESINRYLLLDQAVKPSRQRDTVLSEVLKEANNDCDAAINRTTDSALMFVCSVGEEGLSSWLSLNQSQFNQDAAIVPLQTSVG